MCFLATSAQPLLYEEKMNLQETQREVSEKEESLELFRVCHA